MHFDKMAKIVNWAVISAVLIIFSNANVYAKVSIIGQKDTASYQSQESTIQRNRYHHPHQQKSHKSLVVPQEEERLQQRIQFQYRQVQPEILSSFGPNAQMEQAYNKTRSTRLRRLSSRNYYNNNISSRGARNHRVSPDWKYHVYNAHSNTFETPKSFSSPSAVNAGDNGGKGDDNSDDVELIGPNGTEITSPDWVNTRRSYGFVPLHTTATPPTILPPPLVPARRGYVTAAPPSSDLPHTTDEPNETNTIDSKDMEKRHICVQQRTITMPVKTTEVYTRPIWKHINTPCSAVQVQMKHPNQMCTRVQLVHEQAFRDVIRHMASQQVTYDCCSGWAREFPNSDSCSKPICSTGCQNGGSCNEPDTCTCPAGFTGKYCEHDINECKEEKPCDQTCVNTIGSYFCECRKGFVLQLDQQSCKKIGLQDDDAFEARDLENEIESSDKDVSARLQKIERSLANERVHTNELQKSLQAAHSVVDTLKSRLSTIEKQQQDISRLQSNLYQTETRTNRLESMLNLLMKCRNGPNANCP
uniref:Epidermal growth factor-like protein 8 n=1 Tax=Bactrocera latifrons TaxID=174628 RepID=A0A0K8WI17_BACLA